MQAPPPPSEKEFWIPASNCRLYWCSSSSSTNVTEYSTPWATTSLIPVRSRSAYGEYGQMPQSAHNLPLADLPRSSQSGTVGVCFHPIFRRAAFLDFLMLYGTGKRKAKNPMEQGLDLRSRCGVREQSSELGRKTASPYQS